MRTGLYPGSFDPVTLGHLDVIARAAALFDRLVVAVLVNTRKSPAADAEARATVVREAVAESLPGLAGRVEVVVFEGLTVELARRAGASHLVRGVRSSGDLDAELSLAHLNRHLAPELDTVLLPASAEHAWLSATYVREIAAFGGDLTGLVPPAARRALERRRG